MFPLKSLFLILFLASPWLGAQDSKSPTIAKSGNMTLDEATPVILRSMGQFLASDPMAHFQYTDKEKDLIAEGFRRGLDLPYSRKDMEHVAPTLLRFSKIRQKIDQQKKEKWIQDSMADFHLDLEKVLLNSKREELPLSQLIQAKNGLLLSFWASWFSPSIKLIPKIQDFHSQLRLQKIPVIGVNLDGAFEKMEALQKEHQIQFPWLAEASTLSISKSLLFETLPRVVLLNKEGKILFNGHPLDRKLKEVLENMNVFKKP